ncbi:hypothetical protein B0H14DRAFT_3147327 [Mycena olivaceomarginata]|nr:hypothetical protein B0H14DRAFT_3147327 [Mycena olivaceomarginata]
MAQRAMLGMSLTRHRSLLPFPNPGHTQSPPMKRVRKKKNRDRTTWLAPASNRRFFSPHCALPLPQPNAPGETPQSLPSPYPSSVAHPSWSPSRVKNEPKQRKREEKGQKMLNSSCGWLMPASNGCSSPHTALPVLPEAAYQGPEQMIEFASASDNDIVARRKKITALGVARGALQAGRHQRAESLRRGRGAEAASEVGGVGLDIASDENDTGNNEREGRRTHRDVRGGRGGRGAAHTKIRGKKHAPADTSPPRRPPPSHTAAAPSPLRPRAGNRSRAARGPAGVRACPTVVLARGGQKPEEGWAWPWAGDGGGGRVGPRSLAEAPPLDAAADEEGEGVRGPITAEVCPGRGDQAGAATENEGGGRKEGRLLQEVIDLWILFFDVKREHLVLSQLLLLDAAPSQGRESAAESLEAAKRRGWAPRFRPADTDSTPASAATRAPKRCSSSYKVLPTLLWHRYLPLRVSFFKMGRHATFPVMRRAQASTHDEMAFSLLTPMVQVPSEIACPQNPQGFFSANFEEVQILHGRRLSFAAGAVTELKQYEMDVLFSAGNYRDLQTDLVVLYPPAQRCRPYGIEPRVRAGTDYGSRSIGGRTAHVLVCQRQMWFGAQKDAYGLPSQDLMVQARVERAIPAHRLLLNRQH